MPEHSISARRPDAVDLTDTDGDTLLVAAPALGPRATREKLVGTDTVVEYLDVSDSPLAQSVSEDSSDPDLYFVRDLYESIRDAADLDALVSALDADTTFATVAAPHELDWLLQSGENPFTESHLSTFEKVVSLRYDPAEQSTGGAVEVAVDCEGTDDSDDEKGVGIRTATRAAVAAGDPERPETIHGTDEATDRSSCSAEGTGRGRRRR